MAQTWPFGARPASDIYCPDTGPTDKIVSLPIFLQTRNILFNLVLLLYHNSTKN